MKSPILPNAIALTQSMHIAPFNKSKGCPQIPLAQNRQTEFAFSESADRENEEIEEEPEDFKDCPTDQVRAYTLQATCVKI